MDCDSRDGKPVGKDADNAYLTVLRRLTELEFDATIDARGRVRDMRIPEGLRALRAICPPNLEFELSEEGLRRQLGLDSLPPMPDAAPVKGTTWPGISITEQSEAGTMTTRNRYTYEGPETRAGRPLEKFRLRGSLSFTPSARFPGVMVLKSRLDRGACLFRKGSRAMDRDDDEAGSGAGVQRKLGQELDADRCFSDGAAG